MLQEHEPQRPQPTESFLEFYQTLTNVSFKLLDYELVGEGAARVNYCVKKLRANNLIVLWLSINLVVVQNFNEILFKVTSKAQRSSPQRTALVIECQQIYTNTQQKQGETQNTATKREENHFCKSFIVI